MLESDELDNDKMVPGGRAGPTRVVPIKTGLDRLDAGGPGLPARAHTILSLSSSSLSSMPAAFLVRAEAWFVTSSLSNAGRPGSDAPLPYCFALMQRGDGLHGVPIVRRQVCVARF